VYHTLGLAEQNIKAKHVTADALKSAEPVLEQCKEHASTLKEIFERSIPTKNDSKADRLRKAVGITRKGSTVKEHMEEIVKNMDLLAQHQVFVDADVLSDIKAALEELSNMPDDDEGPQFVSSGSGPIAANLGNGTINAYTNSGSGAQYNAGTMNFAERGTKTG
jgi:L-lactate utilization protein LutC